MLGRQAESGLSGTKQKWPSGLWRLRQTALVLSLIAIGCSTSSQSNTTVTPEPSVLKDGFLQDKTTVEFDNDCFSERLLIDESINGTSMELVPVDKVPTAGLISIELLNASESVVGESVRNPEFLGDDLDFVSAGVVFWVPKSAVEVDVMICGVSRGVYVFNQLSQDTQSLITPGAISMFGGEFSWMVDGCDDPVLLPLDPRLEGEPIQMLLSRTEFGVHFVELLALDESGNTIATVFDDSDAFRQDPFNYTFKGGEGVIPDNTRAVSLWACGSGEVVFQQVP